MSYTTVPILQYDDTTSPTIVGFKGNIILSPEISTPCACNFGSCLQWDVPTTHESPCATIRPLQWYNETWDENTKALYDRHKRTMHFEVINLIRRDDLNVSTSSSCTSKQDYPEMITYFHIFKNGGTTIRNAFLAEQTKLPYTAKILFTGIQQRIGTNKFHDRLNNTVTRLYQGQQQHVSTSVYAFTLLRDPVTRFLSGLGQVLNKYKTGKLSPTEFPLAPCFASGVPTSQMLDCTLDKMVPMIDQDPKDEKYRFYDFHILPQAFLLRDFTGEQDISIMIMDMKYHISPILEALLPTPKSPPSTPELPPIGNKNTTQQRRRWHARQSRNSDYTGGHDLSNPKTLTTQQVKLICRLYHMDVKLLLQTKVVKDSMCFQL